MRERVDTTAVDVRERVIMKLFRSFARGAGAYALLYGAMAKIIKKKRLKLVCHKFPDESCSQRRGIIARSCTVFHLHLFRVASDEHIYIIVLYYIICRYDGGRE